MSERGLYGRAALVAEVDRALGDAAWRIVTLWGTGGIGKTTVARAVLANALSRGDVASMVPLAPARTRREAIEAIARAAGLSVARAKTDAAALERLVARLDDGVRRLIVIDNAEHLIDVVAELARALAASTRHLSLLVTSREPLSVAGERVIPVGPLGLPEPGADPRASDAVRLLVERAEDAHGRALAAPPEVLASLVERTAGVPLAIELCAARLDVLTAEELLSRLEGSPSVLKTQRRDIDERHRSLASCIDSSVSALDASERALLFSLRVLGPRFDVQMVEAVTGDSAVVDRLSSLVRKSLVLRAQGAESVELSLLTPVRDFLLEAEPLELPLVAAHAAAAIARAEAHGARVGKVGGASALAELSAVAHDLALVVERLGASSDPDMARLAARALFALRPLAAVQGPVSTFAELAEGLVTRGASLDPWTGARTLATHGDALRDLSSFTEARAALGAAASAMRALAGGDAAREVVLADALLALGRVATEQADFDAAIAALTESIALSTKHSDAALVGVALSMRGSASHRRGALADARRDYAASDEALSGSDDAHARAWNEMRLGFLAYDEGRPGEALTLFSRARGALLGVGDRRLSGYARGYEGNALRAKDNHAAALSAYAEAIDAMREVGDVLYEAVFEMDAGIAHLASGDAASALAAFGRARLREDAYLSSLLAGYEAVARAMSGEHEAAAALLGRVAETTAPSVARDCLTIHARTVRILSGRSSEAEQREARDAMASSPRTEHERLAARLADAVLTVHEPPDAALVVSGARVRPPGASWIDLAGRAALTGILRELARARAASPGAVVVFEDLIEAGWPGERMGKQAAMNRLRVAVSELRRLGLGPSLEREAGGYRISPKVLMIMDRTIAPPGA